MRWHPRLKFAMPGVIALFLVAVFQGFIPPEIRPYMFASVLLTLLLGLITGQFQQMARKHGKDKEAHDPQKPQPKQETHSRMEPQIAKVIGCISLLLGTVGFAAPVSIAFIDAVERYVTAAMPNPFFGEFDLLIYAVLFAPVNIVALILGILARVSRLGKAGIVVSVLGLCLAIGAGLGMLMVIVMFWIWPPPPFPYAH